jgi:hypothetical protein
MPQKVLIAYCGTFLNYDLKENQRHNACKPEKFQSLGETREALWSGTCLDRGSRDYGSAGTANRIT